MSLYSYLYYTLMFTENIILLGYLTLDWIHKIEFLMLDWTIHRIRLNTVVVKKSVACSLGVEARLI